MKDKNNDVVIVEETKPIKEKTLVISIDWWLWRNIAMSWVITEVAKKRPVKVIASWPLVFWGNPYIQSVHGIEDRWIFEYVIKGNDYIQLEPYTKPEFFNDWENWLNVAAKILWLDKPADPIMYLAEHEKIGNVLQWQKPILFQPFGSTMMWNGADKSYRSIRVADAQYIANWLIQAWFTVYVVEREDQPKLMWCQQLTVQDIRWLVALADRYPVIWCDSSMHHAAKAFGARALVLWSWTDAGRFGYESSENMRGNDEYTYVPFRLGIDFNTDIINQYTNIYTPAFLDKVIQKAIEMFGDNVNTWLPPMCNSWCQPAGMWMPMMWMPMAMPTPWMLI